MSIFSILGLVELLGFLFGLCYILLAYRQSNYSWCFGILSAACIIYVDLNKTLLYFDAILHLFFLMMSGIGLYLWSQGADAKKVIRMSRMSWLNYAGYIVISILIAGAAGFLFDQQTGAAYPYLDAFQMMLSIFATFLIIYCVIDAWSYWIIVDLISITLYCLTDAYWLALLYVVYLLSNALKWREWRRQYSLRRTLTPHKMRTES